MVRCTILFAAILFWNAGKVWSRSEKESSRIVSLFAQLEQLAYDTESALVLLDSAMQLSDETGDPRWQIEARLWRIWYGFYELDFTKVSQSLRECEALFEKYVTHDDSIELVQWLTYKNYEASYYHDIGAYNRAMSCLEQYEARVLNPSVPIAPHADKVSAGYRYFGSVQRILGNFEGALLYYFTALHYDSIASTVFPDYSTTGETYRHIGGVYKEMNQNDLARQYYRRAIILFDREYQKSFSGRERERLINTYLLIANCSEEQLDSAYEYLSISDSLISDNDDQFLPLLYMAYGHYFDQLGSYGEAVEFYKKAILFNLEKFGKKSVQAAASYKELGDLYLRLSAFEKAFDSYQEALNCISGRFEKSVPYYTPTLSGIGSHKQLLFILTGKLKALYNIFKQKRQRVFLDACWRTSLLAADLIDTIKIGFDSDYDKQFLVGESYQLFEIALACALDLFELSGNPAYMDEAFTLMERSKAVSLLDAVRSIKATHFSGIPEDMLEREKALRYSLSEINNRIPEYAQASTSEYPRFLELKKSYEDLTDRFKIDYPQYYNLKYETGVIGKKEISRILVKDQALIEYLVGESQIFICVIKQDSSILERVPIDFPLGTWINSFRSLISNRYESSGSELRDCSIDLYQKLIGPVYPFLDGITKLIIVPDGILGYVPFDALVGEKDDNDRYPYLIQQFEISYAYSATVLSEQTNNRIHPGQNQVLVFAPFRSTSFGDLPQLGHTSVEARNVRKTLNGKSFINGKATIDRFIQVAPDYRFLHFATHAILNDEKSEESYLAFAPAHSSDSVGKLLVRDLYRLNLNAEMAVLSACETGLGNVYKGEGIISLAHGFSFVGVRALVMTLWKVEDRSTSRIMGYFYEHLKEGVSKSTALHRAKLDYIDAAKANLQHPFYWAAFVPYGNMDSVEIIGNESNLSWLLIVGIVILIIIIWRSTIFNQFKILLNASKVISSD